MKKIALLMTLGAVAVSLPLEAGARQKEVRKHTTTVRSRPATQEVVTTYEQVPAATGVVTGVTTMPVGNAIVGITDPRETTAEGSDTRGVTRSTGVGIGEGSSRYSTGSGLGGAGINGSGTLAPSASYGPQNVTVVPTTTRTGQVTGVRGTVRGRPVLVPAIPSETTNTGSLGAGTSTPAGVAPGR